MVNDLTIPTRFIGCDVGKTEIVVFDTDSKQVTSLPNKGEALAVFAARLDEASLVVCEGTGGYEAMLLDAVVTAGRSALRADARKVKAFIRSYGTLGKSDAIDARALAQYGKERHDRLARWHPREKCREQLALLVSTRRELVQQRVACNNRIQAPGTTLVHDRLLRLRTLLDEEIQGIEADIQALIRSHENLARAEKILRTIPGIGPVTAFQIIALMPELGTINRRQAASLAGLAPHPRQSGNTDGYRRTRGGRPDVKQSLFMAAMAAARSNPQMRAFYQRLISNGKKPIVALTAVMRKIIVIANARLRQTLTTN